jgi:hypothetical protein
LTFPGATCFVVAERDEFALQCAFGEVMVSLDKHGIVTVGNYGVIPNGLHGVPLS